MRILRPALSSKRRSRILETSLTANSAAADGVGARKSDTKSIMVKSVSCPTADMTGVLQLNTSLATHSSLNAHKSSIEPPPLPTIIRSTPALSRNLIPVHTDSAAPSPWTLAGYKIISIPGLRRLETLIISWTAAPVLAVTTPSLLMFLGIGFL